MLGFETIWGRRVSLTRILEGEWRTSLISKARTHAAKEQKRTSQRLLKGSSSGMTAQRKKE